MLDIYSLIKTRTLSLPTIPRLTTEIKGMIEIREAAGANRNATKNPTCRVPYYFLLIILLLLILKITLSILKTYFLVLFGLLPFSPPSDYGEESGVLMLELEPTSTEIRIRIFCFSGSRDTCIANALGRSPSPLPTTYLFLTGIPLQCLWS